MWEVYAKALFMPYVYRAPCDPTISKIFTNRQHNFVLHLAASLWPGPTRAAIWRWSRIQCWATSTSLSSSPNIRAQRCQLTARLDWVNIWSIWNYYVCWSGALYYWGQDLSDIKFRERCLKYEKKRIQKLMSLISEILFLDRTWCFWSSF